MAEPTDPGRVSPAIDAEREALLKTLVAHNVQFVVIGGAGIQSHGRRYDTLDIDVTPPHCRRHSHRRARGCPRRHPQIEACGQQTEGPGVLPSRRGTRARIADLRALRRSSRTSAGRSSRAESRWSIEAALPGAPSFSAAAGGFVSRLVRDALRYLFLSAVSSWMVVRWVLRWFRRGGRELLRCSDVARRRHGACRRMR
jgi:hypothetical protein